MNAQPTCWVVDDHLKVGGTYVRLRVGDHPLDFVDLSYDPVEQALRVQTGYPMRILPDVSNVIKVKMEPPTI